MKELVALLRQLFAPDQLRVALRKDGRLHDLVDDVSWAQGIAPIADQVATWLERNPGEAPRFFEVLIQARPGDQRAIDATREAWGAWLRGSTQPATLAVPMPNPLLSVTPQSAEPPFTVLRVVLDPRDNQSYFVRDVEVYPPLPADAQVRVVGAFGPDFVVTRGALGARARTALRVGGLLGRGRERIVVQLAVPRGDIVRQRFHLWPDGGDRSKRLDDPYLAVTLWPLDKDETSPAVEWGVGRDFDGDFQRPGTGGNTASLRSPCTDDELRRLTHSLGLVCHDAGRFDGCRALAWHDDRVLTVLHPDEDADRAITDLFGDEDELDIRALFDNLRRIPIDRRDVIVVWTDSRVTPLPAESYG